VKSNIYFFFNTTHDTSILDTSAAAPLSDPALLALEAIPCEVNTAVSVKSVHNQTFPIVARAIPDPLLPPYDVAPVAAPQATASSEGNQTVASIAFSVLVALAISAAFYFRSLYRERRTRMWTKPGNRAQAPAAREMPPEAVHSDSAVELESVEAQSDDSVLEQTIVVVPDRSGIGAGGGNAAEEGGEALPDSPYDIGSGFC
jgi:hypothetical protein